MGEKFYLDLKDRKILSFLDFDSRMTVSELAKKTGLSKQSADYRIKTLLRKGIVDGFFPVINSPKLGYIYCRIFVQFKSLSQSQEKELKKYVFGNKKLFWAFSLGGTFDYLFVFWVKSLTEFEEINFEFQQKFGGITINRLENVITNVIHLSHKCFIEKPEIKRFDLKESSEVIKTDETDRKIMKSLALNARVSVNEVSEKTGIPAKVVSYRIKKLEEKEIIAGYRPIINYGKLGLTHFKVFFNFSLKNIKEFEEFEKFLLSHPKVIFIVHGIAMPGSLDIELLAESNQDFFEFIKELKNRFPKLITDYQYLIYTKTIKVNYVSFY
ncbi:Lrp/AsnC family transcriptional regulator [Candidatus Micrarchaeota archaeon]|nr:Lrp/AsnC family transcriptional regulator [Candidatus Micrarchaeota archaeon]